MEGENLSVLDLTANSSQNSLTGDLTASSSQNSLTGGVVAGSSQNPMPGGGSCGDSELGGSGVDSEPDCGARPAVMVVPGSDLDGGSNEVAGFSGNCSQVGKSLQLHKLSEKDVPGAALNCREPSQLHVVELKRWLNEIPSDKTCTDQPQQWNRPKGNEPKAPVLFSDIKCVHHTYGKRKAEEYALRVDKVKRFRACPPSCNLITGCGRMAQPHPHTTSNTHSYYHCSGVVNP